VELRNLPILAMMVAEVFDGYGREHPNGIKEGILARGE
jgi:hypothetical protein